MKEYKQRIVDNILKRKLEGKGALVIEEPMWCGKTTTAEQFSSSILYMDDSKKRTKYRYVRNNFKAIIEWQLAPKLWDAIRFEADHRDDFDQ